MERAKEEAAATMTLQTEGRRKEHKDCQLVIIKTVSIQRRGNHQPLIIKCPLITKCGAVTGLMVESRESLQPSRCTSHCMAT